MRLRVGLIGLGDAWEARHRPALRALSDRFEVRAVCDQVAQRAEIVAREFGAACIDSFRALTARDDIDAVLMLSQDWIGPLPILAACDEGKAVYTSVALDIEPEQARDVKDRVEKSGVAFMAELPRRHAPATLRLKELIATTLGGPRLLFCHERRNVQDNRKPPNHGSRCPPELRDLMELVDWCRYVVGSDPSSVLGVRHQSDQANDRGTDYQMLSLDFSGEGEPGAGPTAQISRGQYMSKKWHEANAFRPPAALQVCCERGVAFIDLPTTLVWFDEAGQHIESLDSERPVGEQMLTQFHRAVTSLVRNTSDLEDAYRALHVVLTAGESGKQDRRLSLEF